MSKERGVHLKFSRRNFQNFFSTKISGIAVFDVSGKCNLFVQILAQITNKAKFYLQLVFSREGPLLLTVIKLL